ncbi:MAG: butyrate kinase [Planctomycetota bacterium]|jgi:butyrate kinase
MKIFVINPGSTSTKIALYRGRRAAFEEELRHSRKELDRFGGTMDQADFRQQAARRLLTNRQIEFDEIDAFVGRGGLLRPVPGGVFRVNAKMLRELQSCKHGEHASNLGAIIADALAKEVGRPAYIANPVVVDEMDDVARISGHPAAPRRSVFHALGQKAVARKVAAKLGKPYERLNMIVAFLGGGVTVGAHCKGKVVDVTNGLEGEGPFTPERTGGLPLLPFVKYILDNELSYGDVAELVTRQGGAMALLGTNDLMYIERKVAAGSKKFTLVRDAFIYQVAKSIGAMATVMAGKVDAIVVTGGVANNKALVRDLTKRVRFVAPVHVMVKNSEMEALALAALDVLEGRKRAKVY